MEKLPEKWCILVNNHNMDTLNGWLTLNIGKYPGTGKYPLTSSNYFHYPQASTGCHSYSDLSPLLTKGYIEITLDDFKRLVLKENVELNYSIW